MVNAFYGQQNAGSFFDSLMGRTYKTGAPDMTPLEVIVQQSVMTGPHIDRLVYRVFLRYAGNWGQFHDIGPHTAKGYSYEGNRGTGIIGEWFGMNYSSGGNSVVRKEAGGSSGTGYGLGWGDAYASSTWGRILSITQTAGDTAIFTYTGKAIGILGCYGRTSGGIAFINVDGSWTAANGHLVQTVTSSILSAWNTAGRTTFPDVNGNTVTIAVGMKFFDFNFTIGGSDATLLSEDFLLWEGTQGAHILQLTCAGFDYAGSTSNKQVAFGAFFGSSSTLGLLKDTITNGTQYLPSSGSLTTKGYYILKDREACGARGYSDYSTATPTGCDCQVLGGVHEIQGKRAGTTPLFCEETHADGSGNTSGPYEQGYSGFRTLITNGTSSAAGQKVLKLLSGHGTGISAAQVFWHEAHGDGQVLTVDTISTDDITMVENITTATGTNAFERVLYCQGKVSGAVTNSKTVTNSTATHQITAGCVVAFLKAGSVPVIARVGGVSGATITLTNQATIGDGAAVLLVSVPNKGTVFVMDDRPFWLRPGAFWAGTNFECFVYSATGCHEEATTTSAAMAVGATSFSATSATNLAIGDTVNIDSMGKCQVSAYVTNVSGTTITIDKAVPFYVNSGARVVAAHTIKQRTYSAAVGQFGFIEQRLRTNRGGDTVGSGYPWMLNNGRAIRFGIEGTGKRFYNHEGFDSYCVLNGDGSVVRAYSPTLPSPASTTTAGGTTSDVTTAGAIAGAFLFGSAAGSRGTPIFLRQPAIRLESTRTRLGAVGSFIRKIADGSIKVYSNRSTNSAADTDDLVIPASHELHSVVSYIGEFPGAASAILAL